MSELLTANSQAEESLLGAILIESTDGTRDTIEEVSKIITASDFRDFRCSRIFSAMQQCSLPPHQINTARSLHEINKLEKNDCAYLCHLVSICPCSLDYLDYAKAVKEYSNQRGGVKKPSYKGSI